MLKRLGAALTVAALLTISAMAQSASPPAGEAAPQPPAAAPAPDVVKIDVRRGDQWTYQIRDALTHTVKGTLSLVVADVMPKEIDVRATFANAKTRAETTFPLDYDCNWQTIESPQLSIAQRDEPPNVLEHPTIGKSWTYSYVATVKANGATKKWNGRAEILGWEKVVLSSGKAFDAFKIQRHETDGKLTEGAETSDVTMDARRVDALAIIWFAPAVNRSVREVSETRINGRLFDGAEQELLLYERHNPD